ncbi:MAG: hypothetical protein ACRYGP_22195 [Janthinobacterium lividum]
MTLRLTFRQPHLSIKNFPEIEIPKLSVITGRNGSGKSHMLEAIAAGHIQCFKDEVQISANQNEIRSYSWATLVPQATSEFSSEASRNER